MKKNWQSRLILVALLCIFISCVFYSSKLAEEVIKYSSLFFYKYFSVSFIFFVITSLLMDYKFPDYCMYLLHLKNNYFAFLIISILSGTPSGAICVREGLKNNIITTNEAKQVIMFTYFPNPLFVFSTIYLVIDSYALTFSLYLSIILSNFIIFLFCKNKNNYISLEKNNNSFIDNLTKSIFSSFKTIILIYGTSLFFYLVSFFITNIFNFSSLLFVLINGVFDLTNGIVSMSLISNMLLKCILILFFTSFGTLSIHMQIKSILVDTLDIYNNFLLGRIISTLIAIIIFIILFHIN